MRINPNIASDLHCSPKDSVHSFILPITSLQSSQLYISQKKLDRVREWFNKDLLDPIPIIKLNRYNLITDGHTRLVAAHLAGFDTICVYYDTDELDLKGYATFMQWCLDERVFTAADLAKRIIPHNEYEQVWIKRCMTYE